jgi:hypothetical protein
VDSHTKSVRDGSLNRDAPPGPVNLPPYAFLGPNLAAMPRRPVPENGGPVIKSVRYKWGGQEGAVRED